ncbi:MAG: hypothetical protein ACE5OZ_15585 [Candidatus Heimdallarchaeota archaeon]
MNVKRAIEMIHNVLRSGLVLLKRLNGLSRIVELRKLYSQVFKQEIGSSVQVLIHEKAINRTGIHLLTEYIDQHLGLA